MFDSQKTTVEGVGPTEDYIRLQLLLARAEESYSIDACRNRIIDVYFSIGTLDDPSLRASCFAWLLAAINRMGHGEEFESKEGIRDLTISEIKSDVDSLLQQTAEHLYQIDVMLPYMEKLSVGSGWESWQEDGYR
jgi:hypothetical protein